MAQHLVVHHARLSVGEVEGQAGQRGELGLCFGLGKLPQAPKEPFRSAMSEQDLALAKEQGGIAGQERLVIVSFAFRHQGKLGGAIVFVGSTLAAQRAGGAAGVLGSANQRAQLHQALVKVAGTFLGHEQSAESPQLFDSGRRFDVLFDLEDAAEQTSHVAVDESLLGTIGNGGDGASRVSTNAG
jgi:hypothetical protein